MQVKKRWVIKAGNQFVGVDSASGGYFFYTDFWDCMKFHGLELASEYASSNWGDLKTIEWAIYSVDEIGMNFIRISGPSAYEIELAALKEKHGIK